VGVELTKKSGNGKSPGEIRKTGQQKMHIKNRLRHPSKDSAVARQKVTTGMEALTPRVERNARSVTAKKKEKGDAGVKKKIRGKASTDTGASVSHEAEGIKGTKKAADLRNEGRTGQKSGGGRLKDVWVKKGGQASTLKESAGKGW